MSNRTDGVCDINSCRGVAKPCTVQSHPGSPISNRSLCALHRGELERYHFIVAERSMISDATERASKRAKRARAAGNHCAICGVWISEDELCPECRQEGEELGLI